MYENYFAFFMDASTIYTISPTNGTMATAVKRKLTTGTLF